MPKSSGQKKKLLLIRDLLLERTDEKHSVQMSEIIKYLNQNDVEADSRSVRSDIELLENMGMDIGRENGYSILSRDFELSELKLLIDCVQVSKFITEKKTRELIDKLSHLCSKYEAPELKRQVYSNRIKTTNESVHINLSAIQEAIQHRESISFKYLQYTINKDMEFRHGGKVYTVNPIALIYSEDNYYLIAREDGGKADKHYRVDKMKNIEVQTVNTSHSRRGRDIDVSKYTTENFSMYGGETERVTIQFSNALAGVVIDRFGKDIQIRKADEGHFIITVSVAVSPQFYAWVFGLGEGAKILEPKSVYKEMRKMLKDAHEMYVAKR